MHSGMPSSCLCICFQYIDIGFAYILATHFAVRVYFINRSRMTLENEKKYMLFTGWELEKHFVEDWKYLEVSRYCPS